MCAQTHGCAYVQPHTPTHPYVYTPMYAHVRTYTRTRRKFSDIKSTLQHCQTEFLHQSDTIHFYYPIAVQSVSILEPHWLRNLYKLSTFITHFPPIYNNLPTISKPFIIYSLICRLSPIYYHYRPLSWTIHIHIIFIFIQFQVRPTHHPINMSVYYKTLLILYIFRAPINNSFSYTAVSHLSSPYLIHYNHFHYGNRIPRQSSAIPLMHNYSFIDFRNEIHLNRFV